MSRTRDFSLAYRCGYGVLLVGFLIAWVVLSGKDLHAAPPGSFPEFNSTGEEPQLTSSLKDYGSLPLSFIENRGQIGQNIKYYAKSAHHGIWFTDGAIGLTLYKDQASVAADPDSALPRRGRIAKVVSIRLLPTGMRTDSRPEPLVPQECRISYFIGNDPGQWRTGIPTYGAIIYREAYPGIDLKFYGAGRHMEYDVIVRPGADPGKVEFRYDGVQELKITREEDLAVRMPDGMEILQKKPVVYQEIGGVRFPREGRFRLRPEISPYTYGFEIAAYDDRYPLIIDPVQYIPSHLIYSTYLGGTDMDYARSIALDSSGSAYIAGTTQSSDFPHDPLGSYHGEGDAWVAKLNAAGTALVYAVFLGGSNYDEGFGIKVDSSGFAYVVGTTYSDDFPMKNALQGTKAGGGDAFVAKLNQAGNDLVYSTYLGGSLNDYGYALALDQNDNVHVTGGTSSSNFPTDNPLQSTLAGSSDVFVTKINQAGNDLVYSTYLGGSGYDVGYGITVDANGNAYVTGETGSTNFPHHFSQSLNGAKDAFVTKINTAGALVFSSFLGGSGDDTGWSISLYWGDCPLVAGSTWSGDFPTLDPEKAYGGGSDAFVAVMQSDGTSLQHSTYLGGSGYDRAFCVTQGADGGIYVTGETQSADFPLVSATQSQIYNGMAAFVTKIDDIGSSPRKGLVYSSFLGGAVGNGMEVNQAGNAFITGQAFGSFPTKNPLQASYQGDGDAFVTKLVRHPSRLQGLVAFYPFNGNANDVGGGGRHASVYYATLAGGYEGEAYYFNGGTAYLEAPVDINPGRYSQLTIGAWAKPDSAAPRQVLLSHDDGGYDRTLCIDDRYGDGWSIFTGSGVVGVGGNLPVDTGQWTFLAASYTNPGCRLMASNDSASVACYTSGTPGTGFKTLYMGAHPWGMDYYQGRLDNVFVFNRWLSEEELDFIREAGAEGILSASRASTDLGAIELLLLD